MLKKKIYILFAILLSTSIAYGEEINLNPTINNYNLNYELKLGVAPFESYGSSHSSEKFNNGIDFGVDVYKNLGKYSLGFGGEVKRKVNSDYIEGDAGRLYAYYLIAKREVGKNYSFVGRLGRTSQKEFDSKIYGALGIEKNIGRVNIQVLAETTRLENDFNDKQYNTVGLKIGYVFGGQGYEVSKIIPVVEEEVPVMIKPIIEPLVIQGRELAGGYEAYKTEVPENKKEEIKKIISKLNESNLDGALEMRAYSDNTGSKNLNIKLANERMDNLENEFRDNSLSDKVKIIKIDPQETIQNLYKIDNDTFENRKSNRRIEVNFIEE